MPRKLSKPITIKIDGEQYYLELTGATILDFEEVSRRHFLQVAKKVFDIIASYKITPDIKTDEAVGDQRDPDDVESGGPKEIEGIGLELIGELIDSEAITWNTIATLFWACIGGVDSGMTVRDAAKLIRPQNAVEIIVAIFGAVKNTLPEKKSSDSDGGSDPNPA